MPDIAVKPGRLRLTMHVLGPFVALAAVVVFFAAAEFAAAAWQWYFHTRASLGDFLGAYESKFLTDQSLRTGLVQASTVAVAALGMTVVIIAGGIDLSAGTALALAATVLARCLRDDWPVPAALLAGIGTGALCGLLNGALVSTLRLVPFIVTLGTMSLFLGVAKWVAGSTTVRPSPGQIPGWVSGLVAPRPDPAWLFFPTGVWVAVVLAVMLALVLRYSVFGRHVFAVGSSEPTARLCGINVPWTKIAVYWLGGLFVGIAGIYLFARISAGDPTGGTGKELEIIAAVVIGGGSLSGGRGSVVGTLAGACITVVIGNGCRVLGLANHFQDIALGVIIIAAVALDQYRRHRAWRALEHPNR